MSNSQPATNLLGAFQINGIPTQGMPGIPATAGNVWFVSSLAGSDGATGSANDPFATIGFAYSKCTASNGDIVVCLAGHAETISAAGGLALNKIGVTVLSVGEGANRATLTFSTSTAATVTMSAASNQLLNFIGICNIDQIVSPFVVSAANCRIDLEWRDGAANKEALRAVLTTAAADNLTLNIVYLGFTAGTHVVNAIRLVGADNALINVNFYGVVTTAVVEFVTTAATNVQVQGQFYVSGVTNLSKNVVDTVTGSTWTVEGFDGAAGVLFSGGSGAAVSAASVAAVTAVQEGVALKAAATITNGQTLFTVAGGPIAVLALVSICVTGNDTTASTLQYSATPTAGSAQTISAASASLASALAGASVTLAGTALATAALLNANGPNLIANPGTIMVPAGTITAVVGVGSTTGTWKHYIRYRPLATGVTVS